MAKILIVYCFKAIYQILEAIYGKRLRKSAWLIYKIKQSVFKGKIKTKIKPFRLLPRILAGVNSLPKLMCL